MTPNIKQLVEFYKTPLGRVARALLLEKIKKLSADVSDRRVLGIGYATPYLRFTLEQAELVLSLMPPRQGIMHWPLEGDSICVLSDLLEMPLPDSSIDLIIAVHAFEHVSDSEELMRELWRIAAPNAELIVIVPRRSGLWAQIDNTPFGFGNPFSKPQLEDLLQNHSFEVLEWKNALYLPPSQSSLLLKSKRIFENVAPIFGASFAGAMCVKAKKKLFPAIARRQRAKRLIKMPVLKPQTARIGKSLK
ncbi:MAG: methyltransferase domain-containing protein [Devosiaceae bacterium]|nr:methyltransferase domain-containing protein [Devosiaceae bacterium]